MDTTNIEGCRTSPQQRQVWLNQAGDAAHWTQSALRLRGPLRVDDLKRALAAQVERHEGLRTGFFKLAGMAFPIQVVNQSCDFAWDEEPWTGLSPAEVEEGVERRLTRVRRQQFAPERGPLLHASLHALGEGSHMLLLSCPSLCLDQRGMLDLVAGVAAAYGANAETEEAVQYGDYAEWRHALLEDEAQTEKARRTLKFWEELAARELPSPQPFDPKAACATCEPSGLGTHTSQNIPAAGLISAARSLGLSVETLLFAGWQVLLARRNAESDFLVGFNADGRYVEDLAGCLGLLDQVLPYHVRYEQEQPFAQFARDTAAQLRQHIDAQEFYPLAEAAYLKTRLPVAFAYKEAAPLAAGDCTFEVSRLFGTTGRRLLQLDCLLKGDELTFTLLYDTDLVGADGAGLLAEEFEQLLCSVAADAEAAVGRLKVVGARELKRLVLEWNETAAEVPLDLCLHELFARQAEQTPDAVAVVGDRATLTFAELEQRANRLARALLAGGLRVEEPAGLYLTRGAAQLVALFGILKAGGAFVPINSHDPKDRVLQILNDCGARFVVTEAELMPVLSGSDLTPLRLDAAGQLEGGAFDDQTRDGSAPATQVEPHNLAYIIYTSGSTGRPKGVMVEHRNVLNLRAALREAVYANHTEGHPLRASLNAPLSFDSSVKQWLQLLDGHTLCVVPEEARLEPTAFGRFQRERRLDVLDCTPSQLRTLLDAGLFADESSAPRVVLAGGEAINPGLWRELAALTTTAVYNVYGPTECTVDATACRVEGERPQIGRPLSNVRVYVLGAGMDVAPLGAVGELCVAGAGVARGYVGDEERTARRFVRWEVEVGGVALRERVYLTGDLVRYLGGGGLEYVGRADEQVKIRGYRIEPAEIESILGTHQLVNQAVVLAREESGQQSLVAYVAVAGGRGDAEQGLLAETLRGHLLQKLPDYMQPSAFVLLDALPVLPSGKIDRRALAAIDTTKMQARAAYAPPENKVEELLAEVWQGVLNVEQVGVHDNFFDLGGHSLLTVQIHSRLQEVFERELSIIELFKYPTIRTMAEYFKRDAPEEPAFQAVHDRIALQREAMARQQLKHLGGEN